MSAERIKKAARLGWGGAVIKTVGPSGSVPGSEGYRHPRPSFWINPEIPYIQKPSTLFSFQNICHLDMLGKTKWIENEMREARESGIPIISSITASDPEDWSELAGSMEQAGAQMIEMNVACPYGSTGELGMGLEVGQNSRRLREAIKATKTGSSLPVMVKLSANLTPTKLAEIAKTSENAGADAISATNTLLGIVGINIETGFPIACVESKEGTMQSTLSGISGSAIKPFGLRCVAQIAKTVKLPISGVGGITEWKNAVEYIMVGAKITQLATAPMVFGYAMITDLIKGLKEFMKRKGYENVDTFCGLSLEHLGRFSDLRYEQPITATIDERRCKGCGRCVVSCEAGGNDAINIKEKVAKVDPELCWGCNLCTLVCPLGAISLKTNKRPE